MSKNIGEHLVYVQDCVHILHQDHLNLGHTNRIMVTEPWVPLSGTDHTKTPTESKYEEALKN
jgi:hypothetical protein